MTKQLRPAITLMILLTLITGVLYPAVVTLVSQAVFPAQANGSLIERDGVVIGSSLIGQNNTDASYFWNRPSAINYNPLPSSGSNLSPASAALQEAVAQRETDFAAANPGVSADAVPADLLYASGSGLDPHISPEAARAQIDRVATARSLTIEQVSALVEGAVEAPQLGIFGQARVNVLSLNLALDALQ